MSFLHAVILGIVEGITEFLPISSTGHLMLASDFLRLPASDFVKSFEIAIQFGAILAVMALYPRRLFMEWGTVKKIAAAFLPTAILGAVFYKIVKSFLLSNTSVVLWALLIGGVAIIIFELWHRRRSEPVGEVGDITYKQAVAVGCAQAVAMIPGVSRSAATILGGLGMGLNRRTIVEFSFLLAVPTMLAATALDLYKSAGAFAGADWGALAVGFIVSFVVALSAIKFLLAFIQRYSFIAFGVYRILVAMVFWWMMK